jgi:hypothetical protein
VVTTTTARAVTTTTQAATVTITAVGDLELGNTPLLPPNPTQWVAPIVPELTGDIVFGNLEGTMTTAGTSKCAVTSPSCYAFRVPPSMAGVLHRAGFTVLNSANNHAWDFGSEGVAQTSAALRSAGITQAGLPGQIGLVTTAGGVRVAFVDVAPYDNTNPMLDSARVAQLLSIAKREATVVVFYMHSGAEGTTADHVTRRSEFYYGENRGNPYEMAHFAIDHGANLVLASGPHVLRGMQYYRGALIAYSLGDFVNYHNFATVGDLALTGALHVTLTATGQFVSARWSSDYITSAGQVLPDASGASGKFITALSQQDFAHEDPVTIASSTGILSSPSATASGTGSTSP